MDKLTAQLAQWQRGIAPELHFWDQWLATGGLSWPDDFRARMDPATPLDPRIAELLRGLGRDRARLLDVGAGPVTSLGHQLPGMALEITATDPLGALYAELCARHGVAPPCPTGFAVAEDLASFFPAGGFDLVHCRNALDHSFDPLRGIEQMLAVTRTGGLVLLRHFPNEAETEGYSGFHQFNFDLREGRFLIWNREGVVDVAAALRCPCTVTPRQAEMLEVVIEKTGDSPADPGEGAARLAAYLAAFVGVLGTPALPPH